MNTKVSQITNLMIVYSTAYSRRRSKKTSKFCVTGLCVGNSPVTGEFPAQRASNTENVFIWWRHHDSSLVAAEASQPVPSGNLGLVSPHKNQYLTKSNRLIKTLMDYRNPGASQ